MAAPSTPRWTLGPDVPVHKHDRQPNVVCRECGDPIMARGLCSRHYALARYHRTKQTSLTRGTMAAQDAYLASLPVLRADGILTSDYLRRWQQSRRPGLPSLVYRAATDLPVRTGRVVACEEVAG